MLSSLVLIFLLFLISVSTLFNIFCLASFQFIVFFLSYFLILTFFLDSVIFNVYILFALISLFFVFIFLSVSLVFQFFLAVWIVLFQFFYNFYFSLCWKFLLLLIYFNVDLFVSFFLRFSFLLLTFLDVDGLISLLTCFSLYTVAVRFYLLFVKITFFYVVNNFLNCKLRGNFSHSLFYWHFLLVHFVSFYNLFFALSLQSSYIS